MAPINGTVEQDQSPGKQLECPKCGGAIPGRDEGCTTCGLVYAMWEAKQKCTADTTTQEPPPQQTSGAQKLPPVNYGPWTRKGGHYAAYLLLVGSALPLLKRSMLIDSSVWVWPWNLLGDPASMEMAAATATLSNGGNMALWACIPLVCGLLALFLSHVMPLRFRTVAMTVLGAVTLLVLLVGLFQESEIYGLSFVPPTAGGGFLIFIGLLTMATVAGANHLRKFLPARKSLRIAAGVASGLLCLLFVMCLAGGESAWGGATIKILSLMVIAYCGICIRGVFNRWSSPANLTLLSVMGRAILFATPLACLIAQLTTRDPFTNFVVGSGGGFANVSFSILKSSLIYLGSALLLAYGLTATVGILLTPGPRRRRVARKRKRVQK